MKSFPKHHITVVYTEDMAGVIFLNCQLAFAGDFRNENIEQDKDFLNSICQSISCELKDCFIEVDDIDYYWEKIKTHSDPWNHYLFVTEGQSH